MNNREDKIEKQVILLGGYYNMLDGEWRRSAVQAMRIGVLGVKGVDVKFLETNCS